MKIPMCPRMARGTSTRNLLKIVVFGFGTVPYPIVTVPSTPSINVLRALIRVHCTCRVRMRRQEVSFGGLIVRSFALVGRFEICVGKLLKSYWLSTTR